MAKRPRTRAGGDDSDGEYKPPRGRKQARLAVLEEADRVLENFFAMLPDEMVAEVRDRVSGDIRVLLRTLARVDKRFLELTERVFWAFYVRDIWGRLNHDLWEGKFGEDPKWLWTKNSLHTLRKIGNEKALTLVCDAFVSMIGGEAVPAPVLFVMAEPLPRAPTSAEEAHEQKLHLASQYAGVATVLATTLAKVLGYALSFADTPSETCVFATANGTRPLFSLARRGDNAGQILPMTHPEGRMLIDAEPMITHDDETLQGIIDALVDDLQDFYPRDHSVFGSARERLARTLLQLIYKYSMDVTLFRKDGPVFKRFMGIATYGLELDVNDETRRLFKVDPRW